MQSMVQNGVTVMGLSQEFLESKEVSDTKALASELCRHFYSLGWLPGTGGSIALKVHEDDIPKPAELIVICPSGVQKERMVPEDMYVLSSDGFILSTPPPMPYTHTPSKYTDCIPLFMKVFEMCDAGAVIHSHGVESCLVTMVNPFSKEFRAECYHYLFDAAIKCHQLGLDWSTPSHGPAHNANGCWQCSANSSRVLKVGALSSDLAMKPSQRCILLDIEGTTSPISFVTDVLFPYANENVGKHLAVTFDSKETQEDISFMRSQILNDLEQGVIGAVLIPPDYVGKELVITALVRNIEAMIRDDRTISALKQLQGRIWRNGYQSNQLVGIVFDDVAEALERWHKSGIKVYIYSSGSREAQLLFSHSNYGSLRKYLCGFFDTTVGNKTETQSYHEILRIVGVDRPEDMLFVTDVFQEAVAARAAGLDVVISIRPGNAPLPENHGFRTIESLMEIA